MTIECEVIEFLFSQHVINKKDQISKSPSGPYKISTSLKNLFIFLKGQTEHRKEIFRWRNILGNDLNTEL